MTTRLRHFPTRRLLAVLVCLPLAGCNSSGPVLKVSSGERKTPVKTVALSQAEVERTTLQPAEVHAFYRAEVQAKVTGFVKEMKADIGDVVTAGTELAIIDIPETEKAREVIEARINRLTAEEQRAEAGISVAAAGLQSAQAKLAEASSQLDSTEAAVAAAEAEFSRTQDLVERQSLQSRMLDEVRKKRDSELANREAMKSSIVSAQADVAVAEAEQAAAKADLDAAKAETEIARRELEELQVMLNYAVIRAPFDGIVTERNIEPGDLVRALSGADNRHPLFVVSQTNKLRIRIPVPETDASMVNNGDQVSLTFPSFPAEPPIVAAVTRRSGSLDQSTRTMMVEVELDNTDGKLMPGMFGQASIRLATQLATRVLPAQAIRFDETGKAYVYVVGTDNTISIANITTGIDDGNRIEVLSGLETGQLVVDSHLSRFVDGQQVKVLPGNPAD